KMRFRATEAELTFLLSVFEANPFPSTRQRIQLAEKLNLDPKQILFWFQNRRATLK
ncbi:Homeodomain-like protein, partial [Chytriomyces sp. MP71]